MPRRAVPRRAALVQCFAMSDDHSSLESCDACSCLEYLGCVFVTVDGNYFASFSQGFRTPNISVYPQPLAPPSSMLGSRTASQAPKEGGLGGQKFASPIPRIYTTLKLEGMGDWGGVAEQTIGAWCRIAHADWHAPVMGLRNMFHHL